MTITSWVSILAGYLTALVVGHFVVGTAVRALWSIAEKDFKAKGLYLKYPLRPHPTISFWHGVAERSVYVTSILLGRPEGIAVWLAFKAVMRWKVQEDDPRHIPGSNIYMIGTAMNIGVGILGGCIAAGKWSL